MKPRSSPPAREDPTEGLEVPELREAEGGVVLRARVSPGASRSRVMGLHQGAVKLAVKAPPERGKANEEVCSLLAARFGVPPRDVRVVRGETSQDKVIALPLSREEASDRWRRG